MGKKSATCPFCGKSIGLSTIHFLFIYIRYLIFHLYISVNGKVPQVRTVNINDICNSLIDKVVMFTWFIFH